MKSRVAIFALLALAACGAPNPTPPTPTQPAPSSPTLTLASPTLPATSTPSATAAKSLPTPVFAPAATVSAQIETNSRAIAPIVFGYNDGAAAVRIGQWSNSVFQKAVANLKPGTLRYPAGTVANYWDWEKGWLVPNDKMGLSKTPPTPNRLEDFQPMLAATHATPVFDLNLLTSDLETQLKMLRHAKQLGMPIQFVELGNEFYLKQDDHLARFPAGAAYGREAARWIAAIRAEFPEAKIAIVGAPTRAAQATTDQRLAKWNTDVFSVNTGADALTIHVYDASDIGKTTTFKKENVATMLGTPFGVAARLNDEIQTVPAGMSVWITEYNLMDHAAPVHGTWAQGLFVVSESILFLDSNKVALLEPHAVVGDAVHGALFDSDHAFSTFGNDFISPDKNLPTVPFARSAGGWTLALFAEAARGMTATQKINFTPNSNLRAGNRSYPGLIGRAFNDGTRRAAVIVNLAGEAYALKTDALPYSSFEQIYSDPVKPINSDSLLTRVDGNFSDGQLILPPYSVTRLSHK